MGTFPPKFRPVAVLVWCMACGAVVGLTGKYVRSDDQSPSPAIRDAGEQPSPVARVPYDPDLTRKTVVFWEERSKRDAEGVLELRELAAAYLARQRETGDIADAVRAEDAARRSLKILRRNNVPALMRLARSLLAQHRFPEALEVASLAAKADPQANRLLADIHIELGDYDAAERDLTVSPSETDDPNYKALRSRLEAIHGKPDNALRLLREAQRLSDERPDSPAETAAWYHTMVGHTLIDSGRLEDGEKACLKALEIFPNDYRAMTGMAEAATWRGDWEGAVSWGRKAIQIAPQNPEALKLIGDACAARGKTAEADEQYRLLKDLAHSFPRIYDRHWALFCADNDRDLDEALALARKDLELRRDVHGYDALAWVCFKKGLLSEADAAMEKALALGTQEASFYDHAGSIALALGNRDRAEAFLSHARVLNPYLKKTEPKSRGETSNK